MSELSDKWITGEAYEHYMGRWSRQVAKEFIVWLASPASWNWLEVGCGTGALTDAICNHASPASVVACDPSPQFVSYARRVFAHPATTFQVASAGDLPHRPGGYDAVVSGLVLNFIPSPVEGVRSMKGRLRPGGLLAAYVWDYADGMQFLRIFWEEALELDPEAAHLDERHRFPICRPDALAELLEGAGFERVEVRAIEMAMTFPDFESYWAPFLGGTGPVPAYVSSLHPDGREKLRLRLQQRLAASANGPIEITNRAWAVRGYS